MSAKKVKSVLKNAVKKIGKVLKAADYKKMAIRAVEDGNFEEAFKAAEKYIDLIERPLTYDELKKMCGVHVTVNHTGKMSGMVSISTYCGENPYCLQHSNVCGSICEHCFAQTLTKCHTSMVKPLSLNLKILSSVIIPAKVWPLLNVRFFRFESFGDLASVVQVINYFNLCRRNPETKFALWTKNYKFIKEAIEAGNTKPDNLVIIVSSLMMNIQLRKELYPYADKIFTVYESEEAAAKNNACINCGKRHCLTCGRCYRKDTETYVNELLK